MPKKKQVSFQGNIPGKFIPRDDPPAAPVLRAGPNSTRFNSRMAELLATSSPTPVANNENESTQNGVIQASTDTPLFPTTDTAPPEPARVHSRLIQRRIVTMLEALRGRGSTNEPIAPLRVPTSNFEPKSQPITFGQLRQATTLPVSPLSPVSQAIVVIDDIPSSKSTHVDSASANTTDKRMLRVGTASSPVVDVASAPVQQTRARYTPSAEQLLEQHSVVPRMNEQGMPNHDREQPKAPLTVDEILATYYSKLKIPTTAESHSLSTQITTTAAAAASSQLPSYTNNSLAAHPHPSPLVWTSPQPNAYVMPPLLLNEQNRNRPPPPSYSSSVTSGHRPPSSTNKLTQPLVRFPAPTLARENVYAGSQLAPPLLPVPVSVASNAPVRPPPPHYEPSTTNIERSHSALSSMDRPKQPPTNPPQTGFDREFSRLLYGKEGGKSRHQRQKRKAFSDPVKKSVEEAGQTAAKTHRRVTTHLNRTDTVNEEEETSSDSYEIDRHEQKRLLQRHLPRQPEPARKAIVPANPILSRRIPSFLMIYSQESSSTGMAHEWHFFNLVELQSYDAMMRKLYKDENLARVKLYETYRALLTSVLASKTSSKRENDDEDDYITTTAL